MDADHEQELLSSAQGPTRRVRPEFVNYAKRAKRVDVRKLKDNIWKNLDIVVPETAEDNADEMVCSIYSTNIVVGPHVSCRNWTTGSRLILPSLECLRTSSAI